MTPQEYKNILLSKQALRPIPFVDGLCGRVIRGKKPQDFESLSDDPNRKIVMLTDSAGLAQFFCRSGYQILIKIGYTPDYITAKLKEGCQFKVVVFPEAECQPATWSNLFTLATQVYPELAGCFTTHGPELSRKTFQEIEALAGYRFAEADQSSHPKFMSIDAYRQSPKTLVALRALLYHALYLKELYSGDGHTYDNDGRRGTREYFMLNSPIANIQGHVLFDLPVDNV